jgi:hypothetical protein
MAIGRYLLPFAAGFAAGALVQKNWPKIVEVGGPMARRALAGGSTLFERGRRALGEQSEKFSDLVAEIREEEALKAKGLPEGTPPTTPSPA